MHRWSDGEGADVPEVPATPDRADELIFRVMMVVGSLIVGVSFFLQLTTDIEEGNGSSGGGPADARSADAEPGPTLAGLDSRYLPDSLGLVGAPAPTVRFMYPDASEGWLALFEVTGNPLRVWQELNQGIASRFELPAPHAACQWVVEGAAPVALDGDGAPDGTTALHCRAAAVDADAAAPESASGLEAALWSTPSRAYLGLTFHDPALVSGTDTEVAVGPEATPADLADVPYPRGPVERPEEVAGPGDPFPAPLRCFAAARLPDGTRLVTLVAAPVLEVSSVAPVEPGEVPVGGPATAIGVLEADDASTAIDDLAAQIEDAEVVTHHSDSGRTIRFAAGTDAEGGYCEVRETDDPSYLLVLYHSGGM